MKGAYLFFALTISLIFLSIPKSQPDFNATISGCGGSGCHISQSGIVTTEVLSNFQVKVSVSGTTSKVAGELVNSNGNVVAVINSTSNNPFTLTAPSSGTYTVNAGFNNPSRLWASTSAVITITDLNEEFIGLKPKEYELYSNYPNPFNPSTKIRYAIAQTTFTTLKVYSILGQEIVTLVNEEKTPGIYEANFDELNLNSGTYIYKLHAGDFIQTRKMMILK